MLIRHLVFATAIALFTGFASAHYAIDLLGRSADLQTGQWTRLESIENTKGNPYRAALKVRTSGIALAPGEGLVFTARRDQAGNMFEAGCEYRLSGRVPRAALWSVVVEPDRGLVPPAFPERRYIVSRSVVWDNEGGVDITVSPEPRPGNWIAAPRSGGYIISLRLYDTPLAMNTGALKMGDLPRIEKGRCG